MTQRTQFGRKIFLRGLEAIQNADPAQLAQQVGARGSAANKVAKLVELAKKQAGGTNEGEQDDGPVTAYKVKKATQNPVAVALLAGLGFGDKAPTTYHWECSACNCNLTDTLAGTGTTVEAVTRCPQCRRLFVEQEEAHCYACGSKYLPNGNCITCLAKQSDTDDLKVAVILYGRTDKGYIGDEAIEAGETALQQAETNRVAGQRFKERRTTAQKNKLITQVENGTHPTLRPVRPTQAAKQPERGQPGNDPFDYRRGFGNR